MASCGQCEHFKVAEKLKDRASVGHCMRFPRQAILFPTKTKGEEDDVQWLYPLQFGHDHCGEYKGALALSKAN